MHKFNLKGFEKMESKYVSFPIAGCLKHGIQEANRPRELGYFIVKVQESAMQHLQQKFDQLYNEQKEIIIYFFSDDAYSIKKVKRNQSGISCYCLNNSAKAKEKVNRKWIEKDCVKDCEFRQSKNNQKPLCLDEITLRFLIPNISKDRIWIFQSRSYHTINNIQSYIELQKLLGNSIQGYYKLFLSQKVSEKDGNKFTNYVVDIVKVEESDFKTKTNDLETPVSNTNVSVVQEKIEEEKTQNKTSNTNKPKAKTKNTSEIQTKIKSSPKSINSEVIMPTKENINKYYILLDTGTIELTKKGQKVTYITGKFVNNDNQELEIILHPDFADEIAQCNLGSQFLLDTEYIGGRIYATNCQTIQKQLKEAV